MIDAIALRSLAVSRGGRCVVEKVDLSIAPATWFGLIGANGSGKTSLLRAVAGRLPIHAGRCAIEGSDMTADRAGRARVIGFAPPVEALPASLTGGELLAMTGGSRGAALARLSPLADALGLAALLDRWIGDCSAGMRQRLAVALAFAAGNAIVVLDEPFNWLDPVAAFDLKAALRVMVADGLTLVTALHDLATLATCCDAGAMLAGGGVARRLDAAALAPAASDPIRFERETIDVLRHGGGAA
jgi:ABC-type multidrug transport system ATPase subunit